LTAEARSTLAILYRTERRRVLARLIRLLGGFDAAEEAMHEAFACAVAQWPRDGVPANPTAWLISTGRFRMIDRWRRQSRVTAALPEIAIIAEAESEMAEPDEIHDDELRLIFVCCHPALPPDARIALTLREVGGLTTEEVGRAFLVRPSTIAQRIVRAKARIRDSALPYVVPGRGELRERLDGVLQVLYLIFNEGYAATSGPELIRAQLCSDALRLARLVAGLVDDVEANGLLALMLLHEARRGARLDAIGDIILLQDQNRQLWDPAMIAEAGAILDRAFAARRVGPYLLQAAIAHTHAVTSSFEATDWHLIVALYDALQQVDPSPVIALNRALALAERDGPAAGMAAVEAAACEALASFAPAHAARAEMLRRLGRHDEASIALKHALSHTSQPAEQRLYKRRLNTLIS
jgi:RNA polymerase sigma-70 factor (ECF subfamily)